MIKNTNLRKKNEETPVKSAKYEPYVPEQLKPFEGRAGAMDAFNLPSLQMGKRVPRNLYMPREESK